MFTANFRTDFIGDLAMVEDGNNKKGFINRQGKMVIPFLYDDAMPFNEGYAAVSQNGKWGFISAWGTVLIPLQFDAALMFNEGIGVVANILK